MKHIKSLILAVALLVPALSQARITDGKDHLKLSGGKIVVTLDKGFHFVMESPAGLYMDGEMGSAEPTKKTENQMVFDVSKVKDRSFSISFYVCDDQKTVCESHEAHLKVVKNKLVPVEATKE
ncbi:hypothetical protein [Bdellovibrio svalbardensis]|uniref:Uncharacterized protein n=1 Tax=Bdellovibrio svalbardensis TaxID=2972972 RepID=A0ABT6DGL2_9BACT|nr:hypothetical protein [Bdellovibrio svalbardensis]MDG0815980.1 hypothetical protein [Bdellovibrio svalbardensis]